MALVKNNLIVKDDWQQVDDEELLPEGAILVSAARWAAERETLLGRSGDLGVYLKSEDNPESLASDLDCFALICLEFPTFMDGRAYSYARMLRERYGFKGEIRAVGHVLRDQLLLMHRCGFDAFDIPCDDDLALSKWLASQKEMSVFYQPTGDGRKTVLSLRQRRRRAAQ